MAASSPELGPSACLHFCTSRILDPFCSPSEYSVIILFKGLRQLKEHYYRQISVFGTPWFSWWAQRIHYTLCTIYKVGITLDKPQGLETKCTHLLTIDKGNPIHQKISTIHWTIITWLCLYYLTNLVRHHLTLNYK